MQMKMYEARGNSAARLRQRKHALLARFQIPANALPGSLSQTHRRCGKPTCHCVDGEGHPIWTLTFMADGKRHVERIPHEWVEQILGVDPHSGEVLWRHTPVRHGAGVATSATPPETEP